MFRNMDKKMKKKTKIRWLPILIVLTFIIVVSIAGKLVITLPIRNILITGNEYLTDQEIIEMAEIEEYPSFILSYFEPLNKRIEKSPWIQKVKIKRKFFGILEIEVKEVEPLFEKIENQKIVLSNGAEIPSQEFNFSVSGLLNYVPNTKYKKFIEQMGKIDPSIRYLISEITYLPSEQDKDRFLLYMSDGNYIYLTLTKFQNINYYEQVLETLNGKKGILYLDSGNHFQIMEDTPPSS